MKLKLYLVLALTSIFLLKCKGKEEEKKESTSKEKRQTIEMVTTKGTMVLALYNETPKHRDNFIKIARKGVFDSLLFHRVIEGFMIQGGDPDSKYAKPEERLGSGDLGYRVDAEFIPEIFHKKGVLAAARDGNLQRASSASQFYIVQGKVYTDSTLNEHENRINKYLAQHYFINDPINKTLADSMQLAYDNENWRVFSEYYKSVDSLSKDYTNFEKYIIPQEQREVYKTIGGTAQLDQNYTVFGEVIDGLEVVDSIAGVITDEYDRPIDDVRILSVKVMN